MMENLINKRLNKVVILSISFVAICFLVMSLTLFRYQLRGSSPFFYRYDHITGKLYNMQRDGKWHLYGYQYSQNESQTYKRLQAFKKENLNFSGIPKSTATEPPINFDRSPSQDEIDEAYKQFMRRHYNSQQPNGP